MSQVLVQNPAGAAQSGRVIADPGAGMRGKGRGVKPPAPRNKTGAVTTLGSDEAGAALTRSLAKNQSAPIRDFKFCKDRQPMRVIVRVAGTRPFNLNYFFSPDQGSNSEIGKQIASSTVTVDGGTSGYTEIAELDVPIGYWYKIEIANPSATLDLDYAYEFREYSGS